MRGDEVVRILAEFVLGDLRELARRRLQRLQEPTLEEALKEVEEARQRGDLLLILGGVRILMAGLATPAPQP